MGGDDMEKNHIGWNLGRLWLAPRVLRELADDLQGRTGHDGDVEIEAFVAEAEGPKGRRTFGVRLPEKVEMEPDPDLVTYVEKGGKKKP